MKSTNAVPAVVTLAVKFVSDVNIGWVLEGLGESAELEADCPKGVWIGLLLERADMLAKGARITKITVAKTGVKVVLKGKASYGSGESTTVDWRDAVLQACHGISESLGMGVKGIHLDVTVMVQAWWDKKEEKRLALEAEAKASVANS